jgi:hypothetical protein
MDYIPTVILSVVCLPVGRYHLSYNLSAGISLPFQSQKVEKLGLDCNHQNPLY